MPGSPTPPKSPTSTRLNAEHRVGLDSHGARPLFRILDANLNRGREAIRVVEDYLRFVLEDRLLAQNAKQLRHDFAELGRQLPLTERQAARDTLADVGTTVQTSGEYQRVCTADVLIAGLKRLQESLRSLEEYSKPISPPLAREWEQLRYRAYTLERAAGITRTSRQQLASTQIYALVDGCRDRREFADRTQRLIEAGVDAIQLRDKSLSDRDLLERAHRLQQMVRESNTMMIVNDRPDIAVLARADGVHVGQDDLSVDHVRTIVGTRMLIGVSTHTIEQARQAVWEGANYLGVGPTFASRTKSFDAFPGCDLLRSVAREITLPAFAIGGITLENLETVLATGFRRIAVGAALRGVDDPIPQVAEWRRRTAEALPTLPENSVPDASVHAMPHKPASPDSPM